jgi:CRP-like cAMP-binding protein
MNRQPARRVRNRLLSRLPAPIFKRLLPHFDTGPLKQGQVVYEAGKPIESLFFPEDCVLSAVTKTGDRRIEVGTIGNEGVAGLTAFIRPTTSPHEVLAQISGQAIRINAAELRKAFKSNSASQDLMFRHHEAFLAQITQSVACNGLHSIIQRCCRCLLMTHDRVGRDELLLTHEFLSFMLGVRRAGVTETLAALQRKRLIENGRRTITITDRAGLEAASCECYRIVVKHYERLLGHKS